MKVVHKKIEAKLDNNALKYNGIRRRLYCIAMYSIIMTINLLAYPSCYIE